MPGRRRASILLLALVVMATLLLLITLALSSTSTGTRLQSNRHLHEQAFYLAEAGRQRAISTLAFAGLWPYEGQSFSLGPGTYSVTTSTQVQALDVTRWTITSTGRVQGPDGPVTETVVQQVDVQVALVDEGGGKGKGKGGGGGGVPGAVLDVTPVADSWRRL